MTVLSQSPAVTTRFTEHGVPIRNLWHMLLYAWNEAPLADGSLETEAECAPTLDALLASILLKLMQQRLRVGLGRGYVAEQQTVRGIRGRIDFGTSIRERAFARGEAHCDFQEYGPNEPRNQIIRSVLVRLLQTGRFGPESDALKKLRARLRRLTRDLGGIDLIEVTPAMIHRQLGARHDRDYRLMLSICNLVLERQMPSAPEGSTTGPAIDHQALVLHRVYERFVAGFYRIQLPGWDVSAQKRLNWPTREPNERLPQMVPDLLLQERSSGRLLIVDTKFTAHSLVDNRWGKPVLDSAHLFQLYAYLKSQEHLSPAHRAAAGILLYPAAQYQLSESIELQDHLMRFECVDLARPWHEIEKRLKELVEN